ncbi:MAG TPA: glutathione synthase, partial [Legionellaceae bacterium]|nr:glutathione synthase [Legionellaceae bacterium]
KIAVFMDALDDIDPDTDSSMAMMSEAYARGWQCAYFTQKDLFAQGGEAFAVVTDLEVDVDCQWIERISRTQPLNDFDIILIRKDPPFDLDYLYATQILELAEYQGVLVTNKPQSLRNHNEKLSVLQYPAVCPPTLVSADMERLKAFWQQQNTVIFKPLDAMGGKSVFHVDEKGRNLGVIIETLTELGTKFIMAQRYIPEVQHAGDKRIILINGQPMSHALARFPKHGESRANIAAGGIGKVVPITDQDKALCQAIAPSLCHQELYFVGIDVIGEYITEINVTSPTCVRQITRATGLNIIGDYLDFLEKKVLGD